MLGGSGLVIPNVPPEKLLEAMEKFDEELRDTDNWSSWEQNGAYKHAILHSDRHYPVKQIISMATGEPKTNFSGGIEANSYASKRGLVTVPLQDEKTEVNGLSIRDGLEEILAHYASARANDNFAGHALWKSFKKSQSALEATTAVQERNNTLKVKPSRGQGNWVTIPWIALFDTRETDTIQRGVYCAYLFREDMSGVYLTFTQGVTDYKERYKKTVLAREHSRAHAKDLQQYCGDLTKHGFALDKATDLRTKAALGKDYEASTVAHKFYAAGSVPDDAALSDDLEALLEVYDRYLAGGSASSPVPAGGVVDSVQTQQMLSTELAEKTNLTQQELEEIGFLLEGKRQMIFEGPPGAGKTYVAELFARHFAGNALEGPHDQRIVVVQFHQSYGYEDFVQGIRPETNAKGQLEYRVRDGVFKRLCDTAARNPDENFVIVVDEINRGNISRVFGELLFLLEYRNKSVSLPYARPGDPLFSIPKNVYMIGTMNTTDRSLAQIDYALRRRFFFYRMLPVVDGAAPVLERWLRKQNLGQESREQALRLFVALNERIRLHLGEHYQVGHSYFMSLDIATEAGRDRAWAYSVMPLLEEYFYNYRDRQTVLSEFAIDNLLSDQG